MKADDEDFEDIEKLDGESLNDGDADPSEFGYERGE